MKKVTISFTGETEVEVDESDVTEDESIEDIAINLADADLFRFGITYLDMYVESID